MLVDAWVERFGSCRRCPMMSSMDSLERSATGTKNSLGGTPIHAHKAVNEARSGWDPDSTLASVLKLTFAASAALRSDSRLARLWERKVAPNFSRSNRSSSSGGPAVSSTGSLWSVAGFTSTSPGRLS
jgi:hypothetical protein